MRLSAYMRQERVIAHSDGGTIIERWKWGRRLLLDDTAVTPNGNLRHGVLQKIIDKAKAHGIKLSEREIRRRLQCAKTYVTEAEIGRAVADFETWHDLAAANFPPVELDEPGDPYDPRWTSERDRDNRRKIHRLAQEILYGLESLIPGLNEFTALGEAEKIIAERIELDARKLQEDNAAAARILELIEAVDGDRSATIGEALDVLYPEDEIDESDPEA